MCREYSSHRDFDVMMSVSCMIITMRVRVCKTETCFYAIKTIGAPGLIGIHPVIVAPLKECD